MTWPVNTSPFGPNRTPLLIGLGLQDGTSVVPVGADTATGALAVVSYVYDGTSNTTLRTPGVFKTTTATASGNTIVWTPTTGKKFRLMGYAIYAPDDVQAAVAGDIDVTLNDSGSAIGLGFTFWAPDNSSTSNRHSDSSGPVQLGNGYLSAAANNVLNINLSSALTLGKLRVTVWGTEE